jgi:7-alpha-hydroxysteroid dehydrogenase
MGEINFVILDRFRLTDQAAVVTGAGRGIGAAIAVAYAQAGADVLIASRTQEQLDKVAAQIAEAGRRAVVVPADLNDTASLPALVERAMSEFGRLDIVVNNVGGTGPRPFLDTSEGYLERAFHFNVTTAFALSKAAAPHMLAGGGGSIVNISSAMGRLRDRGFVAYGVAKAALAHMTRLLAIDLAPRVRVNGIAVGSVATSALETVLQTESLLNEMVDKTPMKRLGEPEDIAAAAVYLASPAGAFITGKLIEVDGGLEAPNLGLNLPDL